MFDSDSVIWGKNAGDPRRLLLIDQFALLPEFRKYRIPAAAIESLLRQVNSANDLVILDTTPIQFRDEKQVFTTDIELECDANEAQSKIQNCFSRIGFHKSYEEYMLLDHLEFKKIRSGL